MTANSTVTPFKDRRAEGARFSEESVHQILDFYPDLACLCRNGKIDWINEKGAELLGLESPDDAVNQFFAHYLGSDFADISENLVTLMLEEKTPFPARLRSANGSIISVNLSVQWARELGDDAVILTAQNITQRIRLLEEIKNSEARYRNLIDNALDLVCASDDGKISFINRTGLDLLNAENWTDIFGKNIEDIFQEDYKLIFQSSLAELSAEEKLFPAKLKRVDDQVIDVHVKITRSGSVTDNSFMIEARDISEHRRAVMTLHQTNLELEDRVENRTRELSEEVVRRREAEDKLRYAATHDFLTGLPNRVRLLEELAVEKDRAMKDGKSIAVLFIDLDGFKAVNDSLGHDAGDIVLRQVAERLNSSIRKADIAARIGGDEFVVVLLDVGIKSVIQTLAQKILNSLSERYKIDDNITAEIGGSIGISIYPDNAETVEMLLKKADIAMYRVKEAGKNNIEFVDNRIL